MTGQGSFSVAGRKVVVVGAARSGVAAAELLVRRGATVTLTDVRPSIQEDTQLRNAGVQLELGGHRPETLRAADLIVLSPGVPPTITRTNSCLMRSATVPSAPPSASDPTSPMNTSAG